MNIKQIFKEEFHDSFKIHMGILDIFKNPSQKEIAEVAKEFNAKEKGFRYIAFPNKTLYVFSDRFLHVDVIQKLKIKYNKIYLGGHACKNGNIWETKSLHNVEVGNTERILKIDWSWLKKYKIETDKELNYIKKELEHDE